jgi:hypothetical protein
MIFQAHILQFPAALALGQGLRLPASLLRLLP